MTYNISNITLTRVVFSLQMISTTIFFKSPITDYRCYQKEGYSVVV